MHQISITSDIIGQLRQTPGWLWVKTPGCLQEMFFDRTGLPKLDGAPSAYKVFLIDETDDRVYGVGSLTEVSGELLFTDLEYYIESPVYARKDGKAGLAEPGEAEGILDGIQPYTGKRTYLDYEPVSDREDDVRRYNYNTGLMTNSNTVIFGTAEKVTENGFSLADRYSDANLCHADGLRGLKEGDFVKVQGRVTGYSLTRDPEYPEEPLICRHITVHSLTVFGESGSEAVIRCAGPDGDKLNCLTEDVLESLKNDPRALWLSVRSRSRLKAFTTGFDSDDLESIAEELTGRPESAEGLPDRIRVFMFAGCNDIYAIGHLVKGPRDNYIAVADYIIEASVGALDGFCDEGVDRAKAAAVISELRPFAGQGPRDHDCDRFERFNKAERYVRVRGIVSNVDDDTIDLRCGRETVRCDLTDHQQEGNLLFKRGDAVTVEGVTDSFDDIKAHNVITENI